jgi:hypothetical protein
MTGDRNEQHRPHRDTVLLAELEHLLADRRRGKSDVVQAEAWLALEPETDGDPAGEPDWSGLWTPVRARG